ncbi:putative DNA-binding transcriptional regulator YafY [Desulfobotulus alkaliphilus]|uniref:Putative DNA-binding transcriptional regulator YafY n=1 Tax=Desulfobotulus alkaliphilus TaxID=622671 RepID=A0A562R481_9BACT|nr:WYL domain-containing protein [Desulfobotulus alkaliphilus]TWI63404.1 putative DNA-binding transcriptional regulator YafY [Desulfobotulus alkaliphilus]
MTQADLFQQCALILKAVSLIQRPQGARLKELENYLGMSRKDIVNLTQTMFDLGFRLEDFYDEDGERSENKGKVLKFEKNYVKRMPSISLQDLDLTEEEIIALYLLKGERDVFAGTVIEDEIQRFFLKLKNLLPESLKDQPDRLEHIFIPLPDFSRDYRGKEKLIHTLTEAIQKRVVCNISYQPLDAEKKKTYADTRPLHLFKHNGSLYLLFLFADSSKPYILAIERIDSVRPFPWKKFTLPEDFKAEDLFRDTLGIIRDKPMQVKIRLESGLVKYVQERPLMHNQILEKQDDGFYILSFRASGRPDLKKWILRSGGKARLLEPQDLRLEIEDEVREILQKYSITPKQIPLPEKDKAPGHG